MKKPSKLKRIWVPTEFVSFLHRKQSEDPLKTRRDIFKDLARDNDKKKKSLRFKF